MTTLDNWLADRALKITETERRDLGFAPHQILLDEPASAIAAVADLHRPRKYLCHVFGVEYVCTECVGLADSAVPYPCPTIAAITTALGIKEGS